jgi:hypothetical protein
VAQPSLSPDQPVENEAPPLQPASYAGPEPATNQHNPGPTGTETAPQPPPVLDEHGKRIQYFLFFWPTAMLDKIAQDTNNYAERQRSDTTGKCRIWKDTSGSEIMVVLGLVIYIGAQGMRGGYARYWRKVSAN